MEFAQIAMHANLPFENSIEVGFADIVSAEPSEIGIPNGVEGTPAALDVKDGGTVAVVVTVGVEAGGGS
jgi:hypothetical protein